MTTPSTPPGTTPASATRPAGPGLSQLQIVTIKDLLTGRARLQIAPAEMTFKQAQPVQDRSHQQQRLLD